MKRLGSILLVLGIAAAAQGQEPPPIARYVPAGPDQRHVFVTDSAHVLSPAAVAWLQDSAQALQTSTGADIAWVTLPTLGGRAIEEASVYLGRTWGVGSKGNPGDPTRNRGLVILYIPDKAQTAGSNFRVEVGKGLQGTITDSRSRAISAAMREDLRAKRFDDAYLKGWNAAAAMVREDFASQGSPVRAQVPAVNEQLRERSHAKNVVIVVGFFGFFIVFVTFALLLGRARRRGFRAERIRKGLPVEDSLRSDSIWASVDTSSSSDSGSSGGDFGGGGGFDGGGSSDSI